jgi:hypothetical protein
MASSYFPVIKNFDRIPSGNSPISWGDVKKNNLIAEKYKSLTNVIVRAFFVLYGSFYHGDTEYTEYTEKFFVSVYSVGLQKLSGEGSETGGFFSHYFPKNCST